jgi:L-serine dehydratase
MYKFEYKSIAELVNYAIQYDTTLASIVIQHEMETSEQTEENVRAVMDERIDVFTESIEAGLHDTAKSVSGLVGGDAVKLTRTVPVLLGTIARRATAYALAVSEANAKMFKIVACPTAGSCGIVPAVLFAAGKEIRASRQAYGEALFTAAGIGEVIARNACVAGAVGGCQAECGTAAAMAAAAVTELMGGSPDQAAQAAALCLKNVLGLVCDPVAGLVEVPCVKRNGFYAVVALTAAEMALAGIVSVIPPDEVVAAMNEIGRLLPVSLKETSEGGLAKTETGKAIQQRLEKAMQEH